VTGRRERRRSALRVSAGRLLLALVVAPIVAAAVVGFAEAALCLLPDVRLHDWDRVRDEHGNLEFVATSGADAGHLPFRVERFAAAPPAGTTRILCLGDSTMYGHPFDPPVPFADWIERRLQRLLPDARFEVVNLGARGMCSEDVLDAWRELDGAGARLLLVYVGNNDLGGINPLPLRSPMTNWARRLSRHSRLAAWIARATPRKLTADAPAPLLSAELVHEAPLMTAAQLERGYARYRDHLTEIAALARRRGVEAVFCVPTTDLLDTPPFYSSFASGTSGLGKESHGSYIADLDALRRARAVFERDVYRRAKAIDRERLAELLARADRLLALDAGVALAHYERGRLLRVAGRIDEARAELVRARDQDGFPIRCTIRHAQILGEVARAQGVTLVDASPWFARDAVPDLPGRGSQFVDYCHPDVRGHELIAEAILRTLAGESKLAPEKQWRFAGEPTMEEYRRLTPMLIRSQAAALARTALLPIAQALVLPDNETIVSEAKARLAKALELDSECPVAYVGLGVIAVIRGETDKAFDCFERATALDPVALQPLGDTCAKDLRVRRKFEAAGIAFEDGKVRRIR
jgi:lysophospholipase L1-like esterase